MPRKQKDIYTKIAEKKKQIEELKSKITKLENELEECYKERDSLEMKQIFDTAKEHNLTVQQVIELISKHK